MEGEGEVETGSLDAERKGGREGTEGVLREGLTKFLTVKAALSRYLLPSLPLPRPVNDFRSTNCIPLSLPPSLAPARPPAGPSSSK